MVTRERRQSVELSRELMVVVVVVIVVVVIVAVANLALYDSRTTLRRILF